MRSLSDDLGVVMLQIEEHSRSLWHPTMVTNWWSTALASLPSDFSTATLFPPISRGFVPGAGADGRG